MLKHLEAYSVVLTPHIQDLELFEKIIAKLIHLLQRSNYYSITIEHEKTNRHLDAIIYLPETKRFNNFMQPIYQLLHETFDNTNTIFERLIGGTHRNKKVKKDDIMYRLGYNLKEIPTEQCMGKTLSKNETASDTIPGRHWTNIEHTKLLEAKEFYAEESKFRKKTTNQIISINSRNATFHLKKYYEENKDLEIKEIQVRMIADGYSFVGLTKPALRRAFLELLLMTNNHSTIEEEEIRDDMDLSLDNITNIKNDLRILKEYLNNCDFNQTIGKIHQFCTLKLSTW